MTRKEKTLRLALLTSTLLITCASTSSLYAASLTISPATGTEQVGQSFTVNVNVNGLNPSNDLYDYSFDLKFDPTVFEVLAANDGAIFNYAGNSPIYFDGTIDNTNGFVTFEGGLDTDASFTGTAGLLGSFIFEALKPASNSMIAVQNVSLETFAAALNLGPPDIDPGTLPSATLNAVNGTAVPEPGTGALAALAVIAGGLILRRSWQRQARSSS